MKWVDTIYSLVWEISDWFYSGYLETQDWFIVGGLFSTILLSISNVVWDLLIPIAHFGDWTDDVWARVQNILSSEGILGLIGAWFPWLETAGLWFTNLWQNVTSIVEIWWGAVSSTVKGWIEIAVAGLVALLVAWNTFSTVTWPEWTGKLEVTKSSVDDFFTNTLPTLLDVSTAWAWWGGRLTEVSDLIESKFKEYLPFYDTLVEIWDDIALFFSNPFDFLLDRFADWFLGPEE